MEFVFVLDRSGSMQGEKMDQAIEACALFLKSLPAHSIFNVISFGGTYSLLYPQSQEYSQESLEATL